MTTHPQSDQQSQQASTCATLEQSNDHLRAIRVLVRAAFDCALTLFVFAVASAISIPIAAASDGLVLGGAVDPTFVAPVLFATIASVLVFIRAIKALRETTLK